MGRIIGIISAKGGVGKTTVTVNLSAALMELNKNVIAVDADIKTSSLGLQLGLYDFHSTLNDKLKEGVNLLEALYIHSTGLKIIPASLYVQDADVFRLKNFLDDPVFNNYFVLVDGPPGLQKNALAVLRSCREIIIVTTPEVPAVVNVLRITNIAEEYGCKILGIIINRYIKRLSEQINPREIEIACSLPVIGIVPEDKTINRSIFRRVPSFFLDSYSPSSIAFKKIAAHLIGEEYKSSKYIFLKRFLRGLKR